MLKLWGKDYSPREIQEYFGNGDQIVGLKRMTFEEGRAKGLSVLECKTGSGLRFLILPDRGMDIGLCEYQGIPLSFHSPVGESVPYFYDSRGDGWLWNFSGGLLATCGLSYLGAPDVDEGDELGLHGRIHNTPGEEIGLQTSLEEGKMEIRGKVREAKTLGHSLVLYRNIQARIGENRILITDRVVNEGFKETPHMMLYHVNIGHPVLDKGSRLLADFADSRPRDEVAAKGFESFADYDAPTPNYPDTVFYHKIRPDEEGFCQATLFNDKIGLGVYVRYHSKNLPNLIQWKYTASGMYATGLEPANCFVEGRSVERKRGTLRFLKPGESVDYTVEIGVTKS